VVSTLVTGCSGAVCMEAALDLSRVFVSVSYDTLSLNSTLGALSFLIFSCLLFTSSIVGVFPSGPVWLRSPVVVLRPRDTSLRVSSAAATVI
ncbi:hypothetical protein PMAYCL1PPCAC_25648, partial [Pristionchus mayeri]